MPSYQTILILKPDSEDERIDKTVERVNQYISKNGGNILKLEKWGKKRLAYKVKKNRFGYYLNIYHTCDSSKVRGLEDGFRLNETIIKYLILRLEQKDIDRILKEKLAKEAAEVEKKEAEKNKDTAEKPDAEKNKDTAEKPDAEKNKDTAEKPDAMENKDTAEKPGLEDKTKQPAAEGVG